MATTRQTAYEYLLMAAGRAREQGVTRLPPIRALAADAGVSHTSMSHALAKAREDGLVDARPSRGITIPVSRAARSIPSGHAGSYRWVRTRDTLREEILARRLGSDSPLPNHKQLISRYGVNDRTLRKALGALVAEGVLEVYGRSYRTARARGRAPRDTVLLFARGTRAGQIEDYSGRTMGYVRALEQLAHARGVTLRVVSCRIDGESMEAPLIREPGWPGEFDPRTVLGSVVWQQDLTQDAVNHIHAWTVTHSLPCAILCEDEAPAKAESGLTRNFMLPRDFEVGLEIARFLRGRGHEQVACVTIHPDLAWSRERIAGIRQGYADAGLAGSVAVFSREVSPRWPVEQEQTHWLKSATRAGDVASRALTRVVGHELQPVAVRGIQSACHQAVLKEFSRDALSEVVREVLERTKVSAIVCVNDSLAAECQVLLSEQGVAVPGRISVVGVDDGSIAVSHQLTSYNFNGDAAMDLMLEYVIHPRSPLVGARGVAPVHVRGFVHERAT